MVHDERCRGSSSDGEAPRANTHPAAADRVSCCGLRLPHCRALNRWPAGRRRANPTRANGLSVGNLRETTKERGPAGTITGQRPSAGARVSPGAAVDLFVTRALAAKPATIRVRCPIRRPTIRIAKGVEVPDLTGLSIEQARSRVTRRGLTVGSVSGRASDMPADSVLSQEPAAGTRQPAGTPLSLVIAERPRVAADILRLLKGGRSPATNSITNFRATNRSPSEVTIDADVFYDGAHGEVYLVAVAMNGKTRSDGILPRLWSPLPVGAGRANVTLYMSGTAAESTSTDVELCLRTQRQGPRLRPFIVRYFPSQGSGSCDESRDVTRLFQAFFTASSRPDGFLSGTISVDEPAHRAFQPGGPDAKSDRLGPVADAERPWGTSCPSRTGRPLPIDGV